MNAIDEWQDECIRRASDGALVPGAGTLIEEIGVNWRALLEQLTDRCTAFRERCGRLLRRLAELGPRLLCGHRCSCSHDC